MEIPIYAIPRFFSSPTTFCTIRATSSGSIDSLTGQPPTLVITAGFDPLRDEGRAYAERLRAAGVDVAYREYPGQIHAFVSLTKVIPQGMACTVEIGDYLRARLS